MNETREILNRLLVLVIKLNRSGNNKKLGQVEEAIHDEIYNIND